MAIDIEEIIPGLKDGAVTIDQGHVTPTIASSVGAALQAPVLSPFVKMNAAQFILKGQQFKFVGMNYYPLLLPSVSLTQVQNILDAARRQGVTVMRTWCFDSPDAFRSLVYPVGTPNLITNPSFETDTSGWTLGADYSSSSDVAHDGTKSIKQVSAYNSFSKLIYAATVVANTQYIWTFWYQLTNTPGSGNQLPPREIVGTTSGGSEIANGGILPTSTGVWVQRQMSFNSGANTTVYLTIQNWGGQNVAYYDDMNLSVQQSPVISYNEASFVRVDAVLNEARKRGIKLILSLADGNEDNYNTKGTYVTWANAIYSAGLKNTYPYLAFYTSSYCQQLYKDFIAKITSRVNTVNGLIYKNDPTIFSWELGNELRTNNFDAGNVVNTLKAPNLAILASPGGWADIMSTYIKTQDPNHLVNFGDMGHTWQFATGDTVSNGTFYGVDYNIMSALPNIDFLDFHMYPDQGDAIHLQKYGQRLGFPNSVSAAGFQAQMADFVNVGHRNGKPVVMSEIGFVSNTTGDNTYYTLYNRAAAFSAIFSDFLDTDGADGVLLWHAVAATTSGTYDIALNATGGEALTDNSDDTTIVNLIKKYNDKFALTMTGASGETDVRRLGLTNSLSLPYVTKSAAYTLTPYDGTVVASGTTTITLPTAVGCAGRIYTIKRLDSSHTVTLATTSSQTIDGATTLSLLYNYSFVTVQSDGANWQIIAQNGLNSIIGRVEWAKGVNVASANNLSLGLDGNTFHITGTTQVNLLDSTNWQAGSRVNLIFDGILTIKHNQTVSTTFKPILLASSVDLTTAANTRLSLIYDGTSWYEFSRTVA